MARANSARRLAGGRWEVWEVMLRLAGQRGRKPRCPRGAVVDDGRLEIVGLPSFIWARSLLRNERAG